MWYIMALNKELAIKRIMNCSKAVTLKMLENACVLRCGPRRGSEVRKIEY
jgi:hypothetical protein